MLSLSDDEEQTTPLLRALAKLGMALGESADSAVDVRLGDAPEATLDTLRRAVADGTQVELDYYTYGRDEVTSRLVDPARVFSDHGNWYLHGYCHRADGERVFRVDRIRDTRPTGNADHPSARWRRSLLLARRRRPAHPHAARPASRAGSSSSTRRKRSPQSTTADSTS